MYSFYKVNWCGLCVFLFIILSALVIGCDSSSSHSPGKDNSEDQVVVVLNDQGNVAAITKEGKEYGIDVSAHPEARIEADSVDIVDPMDENQNGYPDDYDFTDGLVRYTITGLDPAGGETVVVTMTFPTDFPEGSRYFKSTPDGFVPLEGVTIIGNEVSLTLTDNGWGDSDAIGGQISDPGGPAQLTRYYVATAHRKNLTYAYNSALIGDTGFSLSDVLYISVPGGENVPWFIEYPHWLKCYPTSGSGNSVVYVYPLFSEVCPGNYEGAIVIKDPYDVKASYTVNVSFNVSSTSDTIPPFGEISTPVQGASVQSSIPVTGWALDDTGVDNVKIYANDGTGQVYVGDAALVEGARPDIAAAYPQYPQNQKAGWGYMMLTNFLPNGGNGTYTLSAVATDYLGNETTLGTRTITCNNQNAVKPFGAIDLPAPGGIASGSNYFNSGWVLTPQPNHIPADGSTINVYVDGVNVGHVQYNVYNEEVAGLFPDYANSNGAGGYYYLDTTAYDDGVHSIYWTAMDSSGNTHGIGSRYFTIQNAGY